MQLAARHARGRARRAREGQSHGTTGRLFAPRARLQIDFSQNLDTKTADVR